MTHVAADTLMLVLQGSEVAEVRHSVYEVEKGWS